jgi:hypothetical protein
MFTPDLLLFVQRFYKFLNLEQDFTGFIVTPHVGASSEMLQELQ